MPVKIAIENKTDKQPYKTVTTLLIGLCLSVLTVIPSLSSAEILAIPEPPKSFSVTLPGRGMTMTEVLEKFGEPKTKDPEVGEPPITRWNYEKYVVVFEYQYVIHSLLKKPPLQMSGNRQQSDSKQPAMEEKEHQAAKEQVSENTGNHSEHAAH